jgi:L-lactate dehydrogenase complex protein LldE
MRSGVSSASCSISTLKKRLVRLTGCDSPSLYTNDEFAPPAESTATIKTSVGKRVSLFVTCLGDQLFPNAGIAVAEVLERLGYAVDFPEDQTCCGQPAFNSGYRDEARTVARHFLKTFEPSEYIVVPSGSCTSMVSHHFADLFRKEPETLARVEALGRRVFEFATFLTEVAHVEDVGARFRAS